MEVVDAGRKDPTEFEGSSIGSNRIGEDLHMKCMHRERTCRKYD